MLYYAFINLSDSCVIRLPDTYSSVISACGAINRFIDANDKIHSALVVSKTDVKVMAAMDSDGGLLIDRIPAEEWETHSVEEFYGAQKTIRKVGDTMFGCYYEGDMCVALVNLQTGEYIPVE